MGVRFAAIAGGAFLGTALAGALGLEQWPGFLLGAIFAWAWTSPLCERRPHD